MGFLSTDMHRSLDQGQLPWHFGEPVVYSNIVNFLHTQNTKVTIFKIKFGNSAFKCVVEKSGEVPWFSLSWG